jgi:transglutaminase-like putative cysteine protease
MKLSIYWVAIATLSVTGVFAQKDPIKFGSVPIEEVKMTTYAPDSTAEAVILTDFGESSLVYTTSDGFVLNFERTTRIKILSKDGLKWGDFEIPLYHEGSADEKLSGLKGVTYNLEQGKVVESKLKSDAIFREKADANFDIVKVTLPNVKVGSVIEITYKVTSDFLFNLQDWEFQTTIPAVWSEYRTRIPEYFSYDKYTQGYLSPAINESTSSPNSITITTSERSGGTSLRDAAVRTTYDHDKYDFQENRLRLVYKDVPAFKEEPYITTYKDYISKINFELAYTKYPNQPIKPIMGSWEEVNKKFDESEDFGAVVRGNNFLKKTVEEITAGITAPEQKVGAIHNYVRNNFAWDGYSRRYVTTTLRKVFDEKKGTSADINLLMASMLEKAGIEVYPVLLSTRDHGFVRETIPISSQFNYVICQASVGGKIVLLDATDKLLPIGTLPSRTLNGNGFVVSNKGYSWVPLQSPGRSRFITNTELALTESDLKGKVKFELTGYEAQAWRKRYMGKGEAEHLKELQEKYQMEVEKSEFTNLKELQDPFKESHDVVIHDQVTASGDMLYFNPLLTLRVDENPFKSESRSYPVNYGSGFENLVISKFTLPEGYAVEEIPRSKVFALPNNAGKFTYSVSQTGNAIQVVSNLQINRSLFIQDEYLNLREFYNQVVAKHAEQVVLKKK